MDVELAHCSPPGFSLVVVSLASDDEVSGAQRGLYLLGYQSLLPSPMYWIEDPMAQALMASKKENLLPDQRVDVGRDFLLVNAC